MTAGDFENYLRFIYSTDKGGRLSERSIRHYAHEALGYIDKNYVRPLGRYDSILSIDSLSELEALERQIREDPSFKALDKRGKSMYSAALSRYMSFARGSLFEGKKEREALLDHPSEARYALSVSERTMAARDRIKVVQLAATCSWKCEIDSGHRTFVAASTGKPYIEGHHIIPLSRQPDFSSSLDCYANIIILCPVCHRLLHYGRLEEKDSLLHSLYEERSERYRNSGLDLSWGDFRELAERPERRYSLTLRSR